MKIRHLALLIIATCSISGCDETVRSNYPTRADAEAKSLFARGWLPEIIPPSSRNIVVVNNLDLNTSNGEFDFDPSEHDAFVSRMKRLPARDEGGYSAYSHEAWIFWINGTKDHARYLTKSEKTDNRPLMFIPRFTKITIRIS